MRPTEVLDLRSALLREGGISPMADLRPIMIEVRRQTRWQILNTTSISMAPPRSWRLRRTSSQTARRCSSGRAMNTCPVDPGPKGAVNMLND